MPHATYPDGKPENRKRRPYLVLLPVGLALPDSLPKPRCALTAPFQPCLCLSAIGGMFSVALSLESPPPDVIRHRVSVEPGLSSRFLRNERPSGHLTPSICVIPGSAPQGARDPGPTETLRRGSRIER